MGTCVPIDMYVKHILYATFQDIDTYIMSDEFTYTWRCWGRMYDENTHIQKITKNMLFPIETSAVIEMRHHLYMTLISTLNVIKMIYTLENGLYKDLPIPRMSFILSDLVFDTPQCVLYKVYNTIIAEYGPIVESTLLIQKTWRKVIADPSYTMCRRRLYREFCDLSF